MGRGRRSKWNGGLCLGFLYMIAIFYDTFDDDSIESWFVRTFIGMRN